MIGRLTLDSLWNFNATYSHREEMLKFAQKSFWSNLIFVMKEGRKVGEIRMGMLGEQTLKLESGERFFLYASFWEQEAYWKSEAGETVVRYRQAFMSPLVRAKNRKYSANSSLWLGPNDRVPHLANTSM